MSHDRHFLDTVCTHIVDIDFKADEQTARERITNGPMPPTAVVESGHGLHVYWKLREPIGPTTSGSGSTR